MVTAKETLVEAWFPVVPADVIFSLDWTLNSKSTLFQSVLLVGFLYQTVFSYSDISNEHFEKMTMLFLTKDGIC